VNRVGDLGKEQYNGLVLGRGSLANFLSDNQQETDVKFMFLKLSRSALNGFIQLYKALRNRAACMKELADAGYTTDQIHIYF